MLSHPVSPSHLSLSAMGDLSAFLFSPVPPCSTLSEINSSCSSPLSSVYLVFGLCPSRAPAVHALILISLDPSVKAVLCSPSKQYRAEAVCRVAFQVEVASPRWSTRWRIVTTTPPLSVVSSHQASRCANLQPAMAVNGCLHCWEQDVQPGEGCCQ